MLFLVLHSISYLLISSVCSLVSSTSKYCDQIGECKPGQHVMCMFYKSDSTMSSSCIGNPIEITAENRLHILSKINKMRSETRHGTVRGKNNILLPKGYGLKELEWDNELASFAQVWANQCSLNNGDNCRATEKFPNPGQFMGGIQYAFPNQERLSATEVLRRSKDTVRKKASDLIESIMNFVYDTKNYVTNNMVINHKGRGRSNLFLLAVYGKTTHIGCGMSYWISLDDEETTGGYVEYTIALVCNLSAQPMAGQRVYETSPGQTSSSFPGNKGHDHNEDPPAFVLIPLIDSGKKQVTQSNQNKSPVTDQQRQFTKHPTVEVRDRYFDGKSIDTKPKHQNDENMRPSNGHISTNRKPAIRKQSSIFNRVPKFQLPSEDNNGKTLQNNILSKNRFHSLLKQSDEDLSRLKLLSYYSNNQQSQAYNVIQPPSTTDTINSHTYFSVTTDSVNFNNFSELSDNKLVNFLYNLIQKADVDFDELVNVTTYVIRDNNATGTDNIPSTHNERYTKNNHNNAKHETIPNIDDRLEGKEPQLLALRKQNPLLEYKKKIITHNENDGNNLNRNNEYYFIRKNVRDVRETEDKYTYRNNLNSYTRSLESDKNNGYYSAGENISARKNWDFNTFNNHDRNVKDRRNYNPHNYLNMGVWQRLRPVVS